MRVLIANTFERSGQNALVAIGCDVLYQPKLKDQALVQAVRDLRPDVLIVRSTQVTEAVLDAGPLKLVSVSRKTDASSDVTTGKWKDGRVGVYYGPLTGEKPPMIRVWGESGTTQSAGEEGYDGLVQAMAEFFQTGRPPVYAAETLEIFEFMTAAQVSKDRGGAELSLETLRK